jgi:hypothetical protein
MRSAVWVATALMAAACGPGATKKIEAAGAAKQPLLEGCTGWAQVKAAGVSLWSQTCRNQRLVGAADGSEIFLETLDASGAVIDRSVAVEIFNDPGDLTVLAATLMQTGGAPTNATCALEPAQAIVPLTAGTTRYVLAPTGDWETTWSRAVTSDVAPDTAPCGRFGVAIVGDRYIQRQAAHPGKAVFVDLGSEIQIYEPNTLAFIGGGDKHLSGEKSSGH